MSLMGAITGGLSGFVAGGPWGAAAGAVAGGLAKEKKQKKPGQIGGPGVGYGVLTPALSNVGQYSAAPSVRLAAIPASGLTTAGSIVAGLGAGLASVQSTGVVMGGGGATGSYAVASGKMRYSHNVIDQTTGRVYRVSNRTGKIIRPRHMNPLNGRAAARAIRRIKGARKMLQHIERALPRARTRRS